MRNFAALLFFIFTVSFSSTAKEISHCNKLFTTAVSKLELQTQTLLNRNKINFKPTKIEGHKAFIILPEGNHPLNQYAAMLSKQFDHKLAVSPGLTPRIDSALYAFDIDTLFTSVKDISMNKVGAATRHEAVHLKRTMLEQLNELHPVFNSSLRSLSKKNIFNSQAMSGYETFVSFDEIEAYATELQYSLEQANLETLSPIERSQTIEDIEEATMRIGAMVKNLKNQISRFQQNSHRLSFSSDEFYHYIKLENVELAIPALSDSAINDLKSLFNEIDHMSSMTIEELIRKVAP